MTNPDTKKFGRPKVDREQLHRHLWRISNSRNIAILNQRILAKELDVRFETIQNAIRELKDAGKIVGMGFDRFEGTRLLVRDPDAPDTWKPPDK